MARRDISYAFGLLCIIFFWIGLGSVLTSALLPVFLILFPQLSITHPESSPLGYFLLSHVGFLSLLAGIALVSLKILPDRPGSLLRDTPPPRFSRALYSGGIWLALLSAATVVLPGELEFTFSAGAFFIFLPAVLILSPLQGLSEELLFRSYLRRWSLHHKRLSSPWVLCPLSGVLFLLAHQGNPEMANPAGRVYIMLYYLSYGALLMYITIKEEGIEAATGIHTANNLFALLIIGYDNSVLPSPAVWSAGELNPLISFFTLAGTAAAFLLLRRYILISGKTKSS